MFQVVYLINLNSVSLVMVHNIESKFLYASRGWMDMGQFDSSYNPVRKLCLEHLVT